MDAGIKNDVNPRSKQKQDFLRTKNEHTLLKNATQKGGAGSNDQWSINVYGRLPINALSEKCPESHCLPNGPHTRPLWVNKTLEWSFVRIEQNCNTKSLHCSTHLGPLLIGS